MGTRHRHPLAVVLLVVFILCSTWLVIAQPATGQPTPEPTEVPSRVTPTPAREPPTEPTAVPTREPRITPTPAGVPTEVPTAEPRPSQEPTTEPIDPNPTVAVQPTAPLPPAPPPTGSNGQDETYVGSGYLTLAVRLCPPGYDPTQRRNPGTLGSQCRQLAFQTEVFVEEAALNLPYDTHSDRIDQGETVTFTTRATLQEVSLHTWFSSVALVCTVPSAISAVASTTPVLMPFTNSSKNVAEVPVRELRTTACTWYIHHPGPLAVVSVHLWACPAGYNWTAAGADPATDCAQPVDGEYLTLSDGTGISVYSATGAAAPGTITFETVPPGNYRTVYINPMAQQFVESGWDYLGACGADAIVSVEDDPVLNQAEIPMSVPSGGSIDCSFYRIPPA